MLSSITQGGKNGAGKSMIVWQSSHNRQTTTNYNCIRMTNALYCSSNTLYNTVIAMAALYVNAVDQWPAYITVWTAKLSCKEGPGSFDERNDEASVYYITLQVSTRWSCYYNTVSHGRLIMVPAAADPALQIFQQSSSDLLLSFFYSPRWLAPLCLGNRGWHSESVVA